MPHDHEHHHEGFDVQVERTGPCQARISLRVTPAEFQKSRRAALSNVAKRTRMKGFRPGKTPPAVVEREYGSAVDRDVVQHFLNHAFDSAVKEHELRPALQPRVDVESIGASAEKGFEHSFEIWLRPTIELGQVKGLSVEGRSTAVSPEEVAGAIEDLRRQQSRPEPAGEGGLPADGMALVRLAYVVDGPSEPALEREGLRLSPKSPPPGVAPEDFEKAMTGAREGEERRFELTIPDDFPAEEARGKTGACVVTVKEAFRMRPASDEELCELVQAADRADLEAKVRERMEEARARQEEQRIENVLLEKLIEAHPMELPEPVVENQVEARLTELRQGLEAQGLAGEALEQRLTDEQKELRSSSEKALRAVYLMEEIAKRNELRVGAEDFAAEFQRIAQRNSVPLEDVRKYYREEGLFQQLALELLERKVRSFLRESADIG